MFTGAWKLLTDKDSFVRGQALKYFTTIRADEPAIREKVFELLADESYALFLSTTIQNAAVEFLSKCARDQSLEKAPTIFESKDEPTKRGAYKLMKALLVTQES